MTREHAIRLLAQLELERLTLHKRVEELAGWWRTEFDAAQFDTFSEPLLRALAASDEEPHDPENPLYDPILLIALQFEYAAVTSQYLELRLWMHGLSEHVTGDPPPRNACPCCGYLTLTERGGYEICVVCFWEDDGKRERYPHGGSPERSDHEVSASSPIRLVLIGGALAGKTCLLLHFAEARGLRVRSRRMEGPLGADAPPHNVVVAEGVLDGRDATLATIPGGVWDERAWIPLLDSCDAVVAVIDPQRAESQCRTTLDMAIRLHDEAALRAVVVTKADLVSPAQLSDASRLVREELSLLGLNVPVYVSRSDDIPSLVAPLDGAIRRRAGR